MPSVVLTGPECTGKTTLAETLAAAYAAPWSPEYAREYAEARGGALGATDVEPIARGQIAVEDAARAAAGGGLVVHDTDLVSTVVYARHYYGGCPPWIVDAARARLAALYLLCAPDVDWADDTVRDSATTRDVLFAEFRATLESLGASVVEIGGGWGEREAAARRAVEALLQER